MLYTNKNVGKSSCSWNWERTIICLLSCVVIVLLFVRKTERTTEMTDAQRDMHTNPLYSFRALNFIKYLIPKDVDGKEDLVRIGRMSDGGYTMVDSFVNVSYAYSIGIGGDYSWDTDIAAKGIRVYMFDHTIGIPVLNNSLMKFYAYGITGKNVADPKLKTLEDLLRLDDHLNETNMILKIDVEGSEWEILLNTPSNVLDRFSQIVVELHWFDELIGSDEKYEAAMRAFANLNKTHQLVWVHGINVPSSPKIFGFVPLANQIEATYIRRDRDLKFVPYNNWKNRLDERNVKWHAELLMWWVEGGKDMDIDGLIGTYRDYFKELKKK